MAPLVGKKAEPTFEELEFIYSRIPLLNDVEILAEMQDETTFPPRTSGSIKRRRKEFDAARKVLEVEVKKELDPATARAKVRHWADLAEAAAKLRRNIAMVKHTDGELEGSILSGSIVSSTTSGLFGTKHKTPLTRVDGLDAETVLTHLHNEFDEFAPIADWEGLSKRDAVRLISDQMLRQLDIVSHRRWFTGACRVCRPWVSQVTHGKSANQR